MRVLRKSVSVGLCGVSSLCSRRAAVAAAQAASSAAAPAAAAAPASPVTIGASLSLSGDFATDGQAFQRGYQLWPRTRTPRAACSATRSSSKIISDAEPAQVITNYNKLIGSDKVRSCSVRSARC